MEQKKQKKIESPFLLLPEACSYLKLKKQTIYQLVNKREISFTKLNNRKLLFTLKDLDEYLEKHTCHYKSNEQIETEAIASLLKEKI